MSQKRFSIKRFLPRTLFGRSLLIMVTPILLLQIVIIIVFFDRHWSTMTSRLAFGVAGEIAMLAEQIEEKPEEEIINAVTTRAAQSLNLLVSYEPDQELDESTKPLWNSPLRDVLSEALDAQVRRPYQILVHAPEKWLEINVQLRDGVLHVQCPQRRLFSSTVYIFILWMVGTSIVLFAIAIIFMRNQIRPIRRLSVAAERFGKGRDVPSFKPEGAHEVRQAARAFLEMQDRIKKQIMQRTAMLAGVSHDLKTPLTRINLQLAMLGNSPDVDAMKNDIQDMEQMLEGYLSFARGEGGEVSRSSNISKMLEKVTRGVKREGTQVEIDIEPDINVNVRPNAFERCLANIVGNARKYAVNIWVRLEKVDERRVVITVEDDGPGIPDNKYEDVFRPFYRLEESRNQSTGGIGLGLPIAQDVIHSHGGTITLGKSEAHGGLMVTVVLPV